MLQMMLDGCWRDITWLDADVNTLHAKRIDLDDS
jgi:uncharacterized protein YraI